MFRKKLGLLILLSVVVLAAPAGAQSTGALLCVDAPQEIAKGNTEAINIEIELNAPAPEGWACTEIEEVQESMGVGIAGTRTNFILDPETSHETAGMQNPGSNKWTWSINAVGDEETSHNLIVFASVDDATRRTGYRSVATIPVRVTIKPPTGTVFDQIIRFLDGTKEILLVLSAIVVAIIGLRGQIKNLLGGGSSGGTSSGTPSG
ncbi:MAG: hypothetical protein Kow0077_26440 [Anaerolineae bacterium]